MFASDRAKGVLFTMLGIIAASPDGLLMRLAGMEPWTVVFCRGLMLAFAMCLWIRITTGRHAIEAWRKAGFWDLVLIASFACTGPCFLFALQLTSVANVLVIVGLAPVIAALLGRPILGETVTARAWMAIVICVMGATLLTLGAADAGSQADVTANLTGIFLSFLTALCIAVQTIACRKLPAADNRASVAAAGLLAAIFTAPLASFQGVEAIQLAYVGAMALVLMPAAIILIFAGTRYINAYEVLVISLLEVVLGSLLVWLVLGETPGAHTIAGGAMILAGIVLCFTPARVAPVATPAEERAVSSRFPSRTARGRIRRYMSW